MPLVLSSSPCVGDGTGLFPFCVSHQFSSFHSAFKECAQVFFLLTPQAHSFHRYNFYSLLTFSCSLQSLKKTMHWLSLLSKVKELSWVGSVLCKLFSFSPSLSRSSGYRSPSFLFSDSYYPLPLSYQSTFTLRQTKAIRWKPPLFSSSVLQFANTPFLVPVLTSSFSPGSEAPPSSYPQLSFQSNQLYGLSPSTSTLTPYPHAEAQFWSLSLRLHFYHWLKSLASSNVQSWHLCLSLKTQLLLMFSPFCEVPWYTESFQPQVSLSPFLNCSRTTLTNTVTTRHTQLFKLEFNENRIQLKIKFLGNTGHISCGLWLP